MYICMYCSFLDQLIKCVDENERKLREVRRTHDKQVSELRDKISELSAQVFFCLYQGLHPRIINIFLYIKAKRKI